MMVRRKYLAFAAFALVSVPVGAGTVSIGLEPESADSPSIEVPVGRIGDEVAYAGFQRNSSQDDWRPAGGAGAAGIGSHRAYPAAFRVESLKQRLDRTGELREAVEIVRWTGTRTDPIVSRSQPELAPAWRSDATVRLFLDLANRDAFQVYFDSSLAVSALDRDAAAWPVPITYYGPDFQSSEVWPFEFMGDESFLFSFQGRAFRLGEPVDAGSLALLDREWALRSGFATWSVPHAWVASQGVLADESAFEVRIEDCLQLRFPFPPTRWGPGNNDPTPIFFLHDVVPERSDVCFKVSAWLSKSSPYPLRYEETVIVDGAREHQWLMVQASSTAGDSPIPWEPAPRPYRVSPNNVELSPSDSRFPADGFPSRPSFSFSTALQSVAADATLTSFRTWMARHPDARVVGGKYGHSTTEAPMLQAPDTSTKGSTWNLVWGAPAGEYFVVGSTRFAGGVGPYNCDFGSTRGPTFRAEDLPSAYITIAQIERSWRQAPGVEGKTPNIISWGVDANGVGQTFPCERGEPNMWSTDAIHLRTGWAGIWDGARCGYASVAGTCRFHWVDFDLRNGNLVDSADVDLGTPKSLPVVREDEAPDAVPVAASGIPPGRSPLLVGTLVTGSLVLATLAAYFAPLIKFHATQLAALVYAYAKIRKSDVLRHATRDEIVEVIRTDPGTTAPEISRRLGTKWSTLVYHLSVLERNGLISSLLYGRHKRFFPVDKLDWSRRSQIGVLKNARTQQARDLIVTRPGINRRDLARQLGISSNAVGWHLKRLQAVGLVSRVRDGRVVRFFVAAAGPPGAANGRSPASAIAPIAA